MPNCHQRTVLAQELLLALYGLLKCNSSNRPAQEYNSPASREVVLFIKM